MRQSSISNVLMPSNSPISDLNVIELSPTTYPSLLPLPQQQLSQSEMNSLVTYWTFATDQNMLYMPWVPFFTNCQGYGKKILWFDLLEYNQNCKLRSIEDTNIVESIPTSGLYPTADECNIKLQCAFSEEVNLATTLIKWWKIDDKLALYYLPSYGVTPDDYFSNRDQSSDYFSSLIDGNTDEMVPVVFYSENFLSNGYPSKVTLKLEYYQKSTTKKKLVKANVILSDFRPIDATNLHPSYTLNVVFSAMGFLDLINAFQFGVSLYFFAFIFVSFFTIAGIIVFWGFNKAISKRENPPLLKFNQTFKIVILPQIFVLLFYLLSGIKEKFFYLYRAL